MTRQKSRAAMVAPVDPRRKDSLSLFLYDTYLNQGVQIFFDADNQVEFIELSKSVTAVYHGFSVLGTIANNAIAEIAKDTPYDVSDPELGRRYVFPSLEMSFWRHAIPKPSDDSLEYAGREFLTVGIGKRGYFSARGHDE